MNKYPLVIYRFGMAFKKLQIQCMEHYAGAKNKRLMIIPTCSKGSDMHGEEEAYFNELMDGEPEFIELEGPYASYRAIDSAEIVVAIDSTLGYESIARGNKTAIFSIRSLIEHDVVIAGHCHIATAATINSGVNIGAEAFIGSNASVRECINICERCLIGMGQQVLADCGGGVSMP